MQEKVKNRIGNFGIGLISLLLLLTSAKRASAGTEWTFMVYLDGDNNLESAAIDDFLEMATVGSDANVDIIVQFDRIPGQSALYGDWEDCQRFKVTNGMTPTVANAIPDWGDGQGGGREVNMGDPAVLTAFVNWATTNYPAPRYALVLWNHGDGWREILKRKKNANLSWKQGEDWQGVLRGKGIEDAGKLVCIDDTDNDELYMYEVVTALNDAHTAGDDIDLLGFDACLMGMTEVAYEVSQSTQVTAGTLAVMVGSEETEPGDGWPYDLILADLVTTPGMNAATLGTTIVTQYGNFYGPGGSETQSAVDLTQMVPLATAINNFVTAMEGADSWIEIKTCRGNTQEFSALWSQVGGWCYAVEGVDLWHFADLVATAVPAIAVQADAVKTEINNAVIANYAGADIANSNGLAIYFPNRDDGFYQRYYENITNYNFPNDTTWDNFLKNYLINAAPVPAITSSRCSRIPTIDGQIGLFEWSDATVVDITNTGIVQPVTAYIKNDNRYLYIAIDDPNDTTLDINDQAGIYFDDDHNHQWDADATTDEGNYWCIYDGTNWINQFRGIYYDGSTYPYGFVAPVTAVDVTSAVSLLSGNMQYEIRIDKMAGALQCSTIGFYFWSFDAGTGLLNGEWSKDFGITGAWQEPLHYGHLTLTSVSAAGSGGGGGGCFIATAAFGTPMAKEVIALKEFRDKYLLTSPLGRDFVKVYYRTSPPIADFIRNKPLIKAMVRMQLKPLVWWSRNLTSE